MDPVLQYLHDTVQEWDVQEMYQTGASADDAVETQGLQSHQRFIDLNTYV